MKAHCPQCGAKNEVREFVQCRQCGVSLRMYATAVVGSPDEMVSDLLEAEPEGETMVPNQIELIGAIARELDKQGFKKVNARQMNAVIEAANHVVREIGRPTVEASDNSGLAVWLASDATGLSSLTMAWHLGSVVYRQQIAVMHRGGKPPRDTPRDPADLGRCIGLLKAVPELRERLSEMASVSPSWAALVAEWPRLEILYQEAVAKGGRAPGLWAVMRNILDPIEYPNQPHHGWCEQCGDRNNLDNQAACGQRGCKCKANHSSLQFRGLEDFDYRA